MKKYIYNIKGTADVDSSLILDALGKIIPEAKDARINGESGALEFSVSMRSEKLAERELMLSGALSLLGVELILPPNVNNYSYVGDNKPRTRKMPVALAATIAAIVGILCVLTTFAACGFYGYSDMLGVKDEGSEQTTEAETEPPEIIISDTLDLPEYIQELIKLDKVFRQYSYDGIDEETMKSEMLKAYIAATGDVYAEYMTPEEYEDYMSERVGDFVGVGVSIVNSEITVNGYKYKVLEVISVFDNSPALENGVRVGDCIVYVGGGENKTLVSSIGYTQALDLMLGEEGTVAEFTVLRPTTRGENPDYEEIDFAITRRKVTTQSVTFRVSETNSKVGIVYISSFDVTTPAQFTAAVDSLKESGCEYFVFDVRNNPGGALDSIETVLSYFLNKGDLIVSTEYSDGSKNAQYVRVKRYASPYESLDVSESDIGKYKDLNCIVLTNENSASAAELFTATMRDYGIAKIVGKQTYGKGCMQSILPLDSYGLEGGLRVTVAMYFSKSHTDYHGTGIVPDIDVDLSEEALEYNFFLLPEEKDDQLLAAIEELVK